MEKIKNYKMKLNNMEKICDIYFEEFCEKIEKHFVHVDKSILPSEIFLVYCLNKYFGTTLILESGMAYGCSTRTLAEYLPECKIKTVDDAGMYGDKVFNEVREKLSGYNNLEIYKGNGIDLISKFAFENSNETISVLLDGPKSYTASQLANKLMNECKNIKFVAVHDQSTYSHTLDKYNENRDRIYSEDLSKYNFINDLNLENSAPMFPSHMTLKERMVRVRTDRTKGGEGYPGLGIVFNNSDWTEAVRDADK